MAFREEVTARCGAYREGRSGRGVVAKADPAAGPAADPAAGGAPDEHDGAVGLFTGVCPGKPGGGPERRRPGGAGPGGRAAPASAVAGGQRPAEPLLSGPVGV